MRLRTRVILTVAFTLFTAFCWATEPYLAAKLHSRESRKGKLAHRLVEQDTRESIVVRAIVGGTVGFVISLIPITTRRGRGDAK